MKTDPHSRNSNCNCSGSSRQLLRSEVGTSPRTPGVASLVRLVFRAAPAGLPRAICDFTAAMTILLAGATVAPPPVEAASYRDEVLADAPVVYYRFEETGGTTVANLGIAGPAANGSYSESGLSLAQPSAFTDLGNAVGLDGFQGYIGLPGIFGDPMSQLSVEMWLNRGGDIFGLTALLAADGFETGDLHLSLFGGGGAPAVEFAVAGNSGFPRITPTWGANEWHHLVVTYDAQAATAPVKLYLNGALVAEGATSGGTAIRWSGPGRLGMWLNTFVNPPEGQRAFHGLIDEFALFGKVLTPARIQAHYNAVRPPVAIVNQPKDAVVLEGRRATFSMAVSGPDPVFQWFRNDQPIAGANAASYTTPPVTGADDGTRFSVRVSNAYSSATSADALLTVVTRPTGDYSAVVLADAPLLYYPFNETSGSVVGNHGLAGAMADGALSDSGTRLAVASASARLGTALDLDGAAGFIHVPDFGAGTLSQASIELWVSRRTNPTGFFALYAADGFEPSDLHLNLVGAPSLEFAIAGNPAPHPRFTPTWAPGDWHHLVVTYDALAPLVRAYLDGVLVGEAAQGGREINLADGSIGAWLNTFEPTPVFQRFLDGTIDEFAFYDTVLTPAQVLRHFAAGEPPPPRYPAAVLADSPLVYYRFDETAGLVAENSGTMGDSASGTYSSVGVGLGQAAAFQGLGTAISLDGAAGFVRVPDLGTTLAAMSIECWLNLREWPDTLAALFAGDGFETGDLHLNLAGRVGAVEFAVAGNPATPRVTLDWGTNEWHHVVVTYDSTLGPNNLCVYVDGLLAGQATAGNTSVACAGGQIGAWLNTFASPAVAQRFVNGLIDEFAIYPTALPPERVLAHYSAVPSGVRIVVQPADALVVEGFSASFSVTVSGPNPTYQWFKNGEPIAGATAPTYTTAPVTIADHGARFSVVVGNAVGNVSSREATLRVIERPATDYHATVLADAPLVFYRFNDASGTTVANAGSLGTAADGTLSDTGAQFTQPSASSALGWALDLDGASGAVRMPDLGLSLTQLTVELWLKQRSTPAPLFAIYAGDGWEAGDLHLNLRDAESLLEFAINGNPSPYPVFAPAWAEGQWIHLVVTYDTALGRVEAYQNGARIGEATTGATAIDLNGGQIGAWLNTFQPLPVSQRFLDGTVDEFAIYDTVLSSEQVLRHYAAAVSPPTQLRVEIDRAGANVAIRWTGQATLEAAVEVAGPWNAVPEAASPYMVPPTAARKFYRLKQ